MTMIVVTHEMGFVRQVAGRVIFMDEGRIVESGTHDELLLTSTFYRQLVQTQLVAQ